LINKEPSLYNNEPMLINKEPSLYNNEPMLINKEPSLYNNEPMLINNKVALSDLLYHVSFPNFAPLNKHVNGRQFHADIQDIQS
ncbi:hypothetical protein, partial [Parapedobacter sp.]